MMKTVEKLEAIKEIINNSSLESTSVDPADLTKLTHGIETSPFYESNGDSLCINYLYYLLPKRCRIVGLPDEDLFYMCYDVLEALCELSNGTFAVDNIDADEEDENTFYVEFKLNGKTEKLTFDSEEVRSPKELFDAIVSSELGTRFQLLKENFLVTYSLWEMYDEDGAALICYLPQNIVSSIRKLAEVGR